MVAQRSDLLADLMVPVKSLSLAKSRLRGAADDGIGDPTAHTKLTLALARDTVAAAVAARRVRRVVVISSDPQVVSVFAANGFMVLAEGTRRGLNSALEYGAGILRADRPLGGGHTALGALQADLPALRPGELDEALGQAGELFTGRRVERAFCADASGQGTTLLVCGPRTALRPRFGDRSAAAHRADGAAVLRGQWPGLRQDVDTVADLRAAAALGLGPASAAALGTSMVPESFTESRPAVHPLPANRRASRAW